MKPELDHALVRDFPELYGDHGGNPQHTCMAFGFECGDGWEPLIRRLSEKIDGKTVAVQVKEKFGGLRFYVTGAPDEVFKAIHEAEAESFKTCEICGEPGEPNRCGWIKTLCKDCNKES